MATAERERETVTATSLLEAGLEERGWGTLREEMLAGKEAKGEAVAGGGGELSVGKNGWLEFPPEKGS